MLLNPHLDSFLNTSSFCCIWLPVSFLVAVSLPKIRSHMFSLFKKKNTPCRSRPTVEQLPTPRPTTVRVSAPRTCVHASFCSVAVAKGKGVSVRQHPDCGKRPVRCGGGTDETTPPQGLRPCPRSSAPGSCPHMCC